VAELVEARVSFRQLQAVASPSRFALLRALAQRRLTVSEAAEIVELAKSTTHVHLEILEREGLVRRVDEERVWIYYELTPLGRNVATANPLRLVVYFAIAMFSGLAGATMLGIRAVASRDEPWYIPPIGVPPESARPWWSEASSAGLVLVAFALAFGLLAWREWTRLRRAQLG
jgi:DNA-binding transcriptional ArsR family regulator